MIENANNRIEHLNVHNSPKYTSAKSYFRNNTETKVLEDDRLKNIMQKTFTKHYKDEIEFYLENYGGHYMPHFASENLYEDMTPCRGWQKMLGVIQETPNNANIEHTIKRRQGEKEIISCLSKYKYKDFIKKSDNLIKLFAFEQLIEKKENDKLNKSKIESPTSCKKYGRHETKAIVS